mmetsp:Transcript_31231/g.65314  ORF Transcript_31231/g.65314 Transcript_31231/m.65314 type:complete len:189 (+) Transcript_31231:151-717(+)
MVVLRCAERIIPKLHAFLLIFANFAVADVHDELDIPRKYIRSRELNSYFNLRLFWKRGYRWQESSSEKKWCMQCTLSGCPEGSSIKIDTCDRSDSRQQFFFDDGRIRSRKNKDVCLERQGRSIKLDQCNNSSSQKWDELSKSREFQLRIPGNKYKCASQHHHPKKNERVYLTSCKKSVDNKTDKWIVY